MEMVLRALAVYLVLLIVFRIAGRRALLQMTSFDLILLLIISEATQQALLGDDFSITGASLTIITLVTADILLGYLKKTVPDADLLIDGSPVILLENGMPDSDKLRRVNISCDDILLAARNSHGIATFSRIKYAILERNGQISIIPDER